MKQSQFKKNDNVETKWVWISKHFSHRYMQFYELHNFNVLWDK